MYSQQINLYQPVFRKQQVQFSANSLLLVLLVMLLCLAGVTTFSWWQGANLTVTHTSISGMVSQLESQVADLSKNIGKPRINRMLEAELNTLQKNQRDGFRLLGILRAQKTGSKEGFSPFFEGLARQVQKGIWLTSISIQSGGQELLLDGKTQEPALVPELLQRLKAESIFDGQTFQVMALKQQDKEEGQEQVRKALLFSLQTTVGENSGGDQ